MTDVEPILEEGDVANNAKGKDEGENTQINDSKTFDESIRSKIISFDELNVTGSPDMEQNLPLSEHNWKGRRESATYGLSNPFINYTRHHVPKQLLVIEYEMQLREPDLNGPPRIRAVWLNQTENVVLHNTNAYSTTGLHNGSMVRQLVVRRGVPFSLDLSFDQPFDVKKHTLTIILQFGKSNVCSSPSMICLRLNDGLKPNTWSVGFPKKIFHFAKISGLHVYEDEKSEEEKKKELARANLLNANKMQIQINSPANAVIGKCLLTFDTALLRPLSVSTHYDKSPNDASGPDNDTTEKKKKEKEVIIMRNIHHEPIYILCNPWKKEDQTYISDEKELAEYVQNEVGWLYMGTHHQIKAIQWNFHQHHNITLNTALYILDSASLSVDVRGDVSLIVRAINQFLSSHKRNGILTGNWSGEYTPEAGPSQWLGSLPILERFMANKQQVTYGHCHMFAAIATSLCRSLGIPSRCVTNYLSAHDCDGHNKMNLHWGSQGQPIDVLNMPNFWTFHIWCEAYMRRPDLPLNSYGGWQAFDPTPQKSSFGLCCAGPCPVEAIKQGDLNGLYDCRLLFSEVHAHHFHWIIMDTGNWRVVMQPRRAGIKLLTHDPSPKKVTEKDLCSPVAEEIKHEAISVKENYKYREGIVLERVAMERADTKAINCDVFDLGDGDVNFSVCQSALQVGKIIGVSLMMQNTGTEERTIEITLSLYTSYYTGISKHKVKTENYTVILGPLSKQRLTLRATVEEYCWYTADYYNFKAYATAQVPLTNQIFCTCEHFCLEVPDIEFEVLGDTVLVNEETTIILNWINPLPIQLTNCQWTVQGDWLVPFSIYPTEDLKSLSPVSLQLVLKPTEVKTLSLLANFSSDRTPFVRGRLCLEVKELTEKKSNWYS